MLLHTSETPTETFSCFCTRQKHQMKLFCASAHDRNTIRRKEYALVRVGRTGFIIINQLLFIIQTFILLRYKVYGPPANHFLKGLPFPRLAKVISRVVWHFRGWRKSFPERFGISALGESHFPKGLAFTRSAKVISRMVWHFRAWRKSFPKRFGISAPGESHFPNGLAFPRLAKVISRKVWHFRARRKSFPERFGISALGESYSVITYLRL